MLDLTLLTLPFFQRALLVGLILGFLMAILGVIVVIRHMSFFSDAIGHAALTGIAIGLLLQVNPFIAALIYSLLVAAGITIVRQRSKLPLDTLLGVFFAASVALGIILIQLTPGYQANLINFLFGNILTVGRLDLYLSVIITILATLIIIFTGKTFIAIAFDADLAQAEGIPIQKYELLLLLLLAAVTALVIKMVGVILVTAMLVVPAASAHNISPSLSRMFIISIFISLASVFIGMISSVTFNVASGPAIILTSTAFFILTLLLKPLFKSTG